MRVRQDMLSRRSSRLTALRALALSGLVFTYLFVSAGALNESAAADGITYTIEQGGAETQHADGDDFLEGLNSASLNSLLAWSIGAHIKSIAV